MKLIILFVLSSYTTVASEDATERENKCWIVTRNKWVENLQLSHAKTLHACTKICRVDEKCNVFNFNYNKSTCYYQKEEVDYTKKRMKYKHHVLNFIWRNTCNRIECWEKHSNTKMLGLSRRLNSHNVTSCMSECFHHYTCLMIGFNSADPGVCMIQARKGAGRDKRFHKTVDTYVLNKFCKALFCWPKVYSHLIYKNKSKKGIKSFELCQDVCLKIKTCNAIQFDFMKSMCSFVFADENPKTSSVNQTYYILKRACKMPIEIKENIYHQCNNPKHSGFPSHTYANHDFGNNDYGDDDYAGYDYG